MLLRAVNRLNISSSIMRWSLFKGHPHLGQYVADNGAIVILSNIEELWPRQDVIEVVLQQGTLPLCKGAALLLISFGLLALLPHGMGTLSW
jgi:hypothetical protein